MPASLPPPHVGPSGDVPFPEHDTHPEPLAMTEISPRVRLLATLCMTVGSSAGCASAGVGDVSDPGSASVPAAAPASPEPAAPMTLADGAYSAEQATQGADVFKDACSECHDTVEFRGSDFMFEWEGSTVGRFVRLVSETMPEDNPGSVPVEQVVAVTAYILQLNDYPAGASPLTTELERLSALRFDRPALDPVTPAGLAR